MQTVKASKLFENISNINDKDLENSSDIEIDFSGINSVDLKSLKTLFDFQKVAILNNKTISLSNMRPEVKDMLEMTGFKRTFSDNNSNMTNPCISKGR